MQARQRRKRFTFFWGDIGLCMHDLHTGVLPLLLLSAAALSAFGAASLTGFPRSAGLLNIFYSILRHLSSIFFALYRKKPFFSGFHKMFILKRPKYGTAVGRVHIH